LISDAVITRQLKNLIQTDVLDTLQRAYDGMSFRRAWGYFGGFGLAGFHVEDAWLHFGHVVVGITFRNVPSPLVSRLLSTCQSLSRKLWLFYQDNSTEGIIGLNKLLASTFGNVGHVDEYLVARRFVVDPRFVSRAFVTVAQTATQCIVSNHPHCVLGFALFSFAWNVLLRRELPAYLKVEFAMASAKRKLGKEALRAYRSITGSSYRAFVLSSELAYACLDRGAFDGKQAARKLIGDIMGSEEVKLGTIQVSTGKEVVPYQGRHQCEQCNLGVMTVLHRRVTKGGRMAGPWLCVSCLVCCPKEELVMEHAAIHVNDSRALNRMRGWIQCESDA
jgi:hypothetical protein